MGKPHPALIVQSDLFNEFHPSVTICPISSHLTGDHLYRVSISQSAESGLMWDSEVEVDKIMTIWARRIGRQIGRAPDDVMYSVAIALRRWLTF